MKLASHNTDRLLIDTNLLVLLVVGLVNRTRIERFKRTRQYTAEDFDLLSREFGSWKSVYTTPHILAEVSNLTDLEGLERLQARQILKETISTLTEVGIPSARAVDEPVYQRLGLVDATIAAVARAQECTVLTDDLDLYLMLQRDRVEVINFTHLRAAAYGV